MGLTAGPVPPRVDADVKAGLLDLVDDAAEAGWSNRRAAAVLGLDADRVGRWAERRRAERLADAAPGGRPRHGLLDWERAAVVELFESWGEVDRSHRKLAHRGSRLDLVHVSESSVRRVLATEGLAVPGPPRREPTPRASWPEWLEWKPNRIWGYDFTHFPRSRRAAIAILDLVSRKWLTTLVCAEESSIQVEVAFLAALDAEQLLALADARASAALRRALADGNRDAVRAAVDDGTVPLLLAVSDNGPPMRSHTTREFMAAVAIAQHFGRPHTPTDQAWIETLFGHVKGEWPHLEQIRDPGELERELDRTRREYNHGAVARQHRLRHPGRRTRRPRGRHPPGPPGRAGSRPAGPARRTPRRARDGGAVTPWRDDNETTSAAIVPCLVCGTRFTRVRRQTYCSPACKQIAWRARHRPDPPAPVVPASRRRDSTVYQCAECDSRYLGEQWCADCTRPCRSLGAGGLCGHCGEPLTVAELLAGEVVT